MTIPSGLGSDPGTDQLNVFEVELVLDVVSRCDHSICILQDGILSIRNSAFSGVLFAQASHKIGTHQCGYRGSSMVNVLHGICKV